MLVMASVDFLEVVIELNRLVFVETDSHTELLPLRVPLDHEHHLLELPFARLAATKGLHLHRWLRPVILDLQLDEE